MVAEGRLRWASRAALTHPRNDLPLAAPTLPIADREQGEPSMAWWHAFTRRTPLPTPKPLPTPEGNALTAAAAPVTSPRTELIRSAETWQEEVWGYYDCADEATEILTEDGWRRHDQISIGTRVLTLDHESGSAGWEPVLDLFRYEVTDEQMLSIELRHHSSLTTLNHRWPVLRQGYALRPDGKRGTIRTGRTREWTNSRDMAAEDQLITAAPIRDTPSAPKYEDAFVELVAWFWTEGTIRKDRARPSVALSQSDTVNPQNVARIRTALTKLFGPKSDGSHPGRVIGSPRWRENVNSTNHVRMFHLSVAASEALIEAAPNKVVTHDFLRSLTHSQLHLFLDVSMIADGHRASRTIGQRERARLEAYEFACILAGRTPHSGYSETARMWRLQDLPRQTVTPRKKHRSIVRYTGTVWCPKTPSGSWLARRDGTVYFTGNSLGEFRYAADWEARMLSRVRFYAAKLEPGADEPVRADAGTAVDLMTTFAGGVAGQAQIMDGLGTQLSVPGEGYLIVENTNGIEQWSVRSIDEVRAARGGYEVLDENSPRTGDQWRPLAPDSMAPIRVWRPNKRYHHIADSPARAARSTMRELELVNRHIVAQYLSRLASAGVVIFPDEVTFPHREEFADAPDPFVAEWVENARTAIATPGTAAAVVPMPIKVPAEYVDKIAHIDFTLKIDEKIIEKRDSAIKRLASQLNVPPEVLLGMGDLNHWNAWAVDETSLKVNVAPDAELIAHALTTGYLQPRLKASRVEDWAQWVVWYDMSELALRPDRSGDAIQLYDRLEINGAALRRETGFDEADKPSDEELKEQGLKIIIKTLPSGAGSALSELTGDQVTITPVAAAPPGEQPPAEPAAEPPPEDRSPPDEEAARTAAAQERTERLVRQSQALHAVRFTTGQPAELLHPAVCSQHAYSCPFTHAALKLADLPRPGTSGVYEARLDPFGRFTIGRHAPLMDTSGFFSTMTRSSNGFARSRG